MQLKTFPAATSTLTFDDVVPRQTSTPHVAAAAFYHCLGMSARVLSRSLSHRRRSACDKGSGASRSRSTIWDAENHCEVNGNNAYLRCSVKAGTPETTQDHDSPFALVLSSKSIAICRHAFDLLWSTSIRLIDMCTCSRLMCVLAQFICLTIRQPSVHLVR